ncbi:unnamed protein product [Arabidopsis thaliana]|uniref:(thale cress) hypothetical protein n=1 Tax=Arabidopsis thaliana TaxID=3702 RepID=A0A7G2EVY6_ARATH|nr:unnamed protein product [Arabidopsis thaliana]
MIRVNYHRGCLHSITGQIAAALKDTPEMTFLLDSPFGDLFRIPTNKASFSGKLVLRLICRQLVTKKCYEMWMVFAGHSIRLGLREWALITGLECRTYPKNKDVESVMQRKEGENTVWATLFGDDKADPTVEELRDRLISETDMPAWKKLALALIIIVDGDRNEEGPRSSHKSDSPSEKVERVTKTVEKVNKRVEKVNKRVEKAAEQVQKKSVKKSTKQKKIIPRRSSRLNNTPKKAATGSLPVEVRLQQEVPGNDGDGEVSAKHTVSDYDMTTYIWEEGGNSEIEEDSSKLHQNVSDSVMEDNVDRVPSPSHQPEQGIPDGGNFEELLPDPILSHPAIEKMSDDVSSSSHQDVAKCLGGNREEEVVAPESQQLEEPQSPEVKVRQEVAFEVTEDGNPSAETICGDGEEALKEAKSPSVVDEALEDTALPGLVPPRTVGDLNYEANLSDPSSPTVVVSKVLTQLKDDILEENVSKIPEKVAVPEEVLTQLKDDVLEEKVSEKVAIPEEIGKKDDVVEAGVSQTEAIVAPVNEKAKKSVRRRVTFSDDTKNDDKKGPDVTFVEEREAGLKVLVKAGDSLYNPLEKFDEDKFQKLCNIMHGEKSCN